MGNSLQRKAPKSKGDVTKADNSTTSNGIRKARQRKKTERMSSESEPAQIRRKRRSERRKQEQHVARKENLAEDTRKSAEKGVKNTNETAKKSDTERKSLHSNTSKEKSGRKPDETKRKVLSQEENNVERCHVIKSPSGQNTNKGSKNAETQCKISWLSANARPSDTSNVELTKVTRRQKRKSHGKAVLNMIPRKQTPTTAATESTSSTNNVLSSKNTRKKKSLRSPGCKLPRVTKPDEELLVNGNDRGKDDPSDTQTIMVMVDEWKRQEKLLQNEYENAQERIRSSLRQEQQAKARAQTWRSRLERLAVTQRDRLFRQATLLRSKLRSAEQRLKANERKAERLVHTNNKLKGMIDVVKEEARSLRVESEKKRETTRKHLNEKLILVEEELKRLRYRIGDSTRAEEARLNNHPENPPTSYPRPAEDHVASAAIENFTGNQQNLADDTGTLGTVIIHRGAASGNLTGKEIPSKNSCFPVNSALTDGRSTAQNPYAATTGSYILDTYGVPKCYRPSPLPYDAGPHFNARPNALFHSYAVHRPRLPAYVHDSQFHYCTNGYPARNNVCNRLQSNHVVSNQAYAGGGVFAPKRQLGRTQYNLAATKEISNRTTKGAEENNLANNIKEVNHSRIQRSQNETQRTRKVALPPVEIPNADKYDSSSAYDTCSSAYGRRVNQSDDSGKTQLLIRKRQVYNNYEREIEAKSVSDRHSARTHDELTPLPGDAYNESKIGHGTPKCGWVQDLEQKLEKERKYMSSILGQNNERTSSSSNHEETNISPISAPILPVKEFRFSPDNLKPSSSDSHQKLRGEQKRSTLKLYSRRSKALKLLDVGKVEVTRGSKSSDIKMKSRTRKATQSC